MSKLTRELQKYIGVTEDKGFVFDYVSRKGVCKQQIGVMRAEKISVGKQLRS